MGECLYSPWNIALCWAVTAHSDERLWQDRSCWSGWACLCRVGYSHRTSWAKQALISSPFYTWGNWVPKNNQPASSLNSLGAKLMFTPGQLCLEGTLQTFTAEHTASDITALSGILGPCRGAFICTLDGDLEFGVWPCVKCVVQMYSLPKKDVFR